MTSIEFNTLRDSIQSIWKAFHTLKVEAGTQRSECAALLNRVVALENKAQRSEPLDFVKLAFQSEVQSKYVGAHCSFAGGRYEVWCPACGGEFLGYGRTERQAWEMAAHAGKAACGVMPDSTKDRVLLVHPGAALLGGVHQVSDLRCIVCDTCGEFLGSGACEDAAWEMASRSNLSCAPKKSPLVYSDFVVNKSTRNGAHGCTADLSRLVHLGEPWAGNILDGPLKIHISGGGAEALYGRRRVHVTITEVKE